ncbi:DUF397 domain-containing protein [Actinosynnema sp. CS-041913]|uniref:DUF397 domain-containing protein n=1 Tax=Actinosynnema sp. CS-041913 TaxID=3239917 RepID=UPI003D8F460B
MAHDTGWFTSSYSAGSNNSCVEVRLTDAGVGVRDSKNPAGPRLAVAATTWDAFVSGLRR